MFAPAIAPGRHVVIERTGRRWKGMKVWGLVMVGGGVLMCMTPAAPLGLLSLLGGMCLVLVSRAGAWWYNG